MTTELVQEITKQAANNQKVADLIWPKVQELGELTKKEPENEELKQLEEDVRSAWHKPYTNAQAFQALLPKVANANS